MRKRSSFALSLCIVLLLGLGYQLYAVGEKLNLVRRQPVATVYHQFIGQLGKGSLEPRSKGIQRANKGALSQAGKIRPAGVRVAF